MLAIVGGAGLAALLAFPTGRYLLRAAWEEGLVLAARRSITHVIKDKSTDATTRAKLELVLATRTFAHDSIALRTGSSFSMYSKLRRDTLVLVLSGAYRDRLQRYTWWFPIVGRVPYKGFFDYNAARKARDAMRADGFDTSLRPASAFSTLGFFNDPILSTTLEEDSLEVANTVIHELTHNTFYAPGQAVFNESFASFVGARGAAWLFRTRGSLGAAEQTDARWEDEKLLGAFWATLYHSIDSAFRAHPGEDGASRSARIAARDTLYRLARIDLVETLGPKLRTVGPRYLERVPLDNAALLARRVYATDLDLFDAVYEREGEKLRPTVARIIALARERPSDPYGALRRWTDSTATR
ncbi:MAG: aminopeptidase [Gemmatimonadaceae bacterium]